MERFAVSKSGKPFAEGHKTPICHTMAQKLKPDSDRVSRTFSFSCPKGILDYNTSVCLRKGSRNAA